MRYKTLSTSQPFTSLTPELVPLAMYRARQVLRRASNLRSSGIRSIGVVPSPFRGRNSRGSYQPSLRLQYLRAFSHQRCLISEEHGQGIEEDIRIHQHEKWGWVIYRTAYGDDVAWERFKQFVVDSSTERIAQSSAPGIAETLEWTFVSDQEALDGISTGQLRARFRGWAAEAIRTENLRATKTSLNAHRRIQRYSYFIEVNEETLRCVADVKSPRHWEQVWVKFVRADWESDPEADDGSHELIDDTTEEDIGWMLITSDNVTHEFYNSIGDNGQGWHTYYSRPPNPCCP